MPRVRAQVVAFQDATDSGDLFTETPPQGRAMEQAVRQVLAAAGQPPRVEWAVVDLNGLERRALDWGHAAVRLRAELAHGEAAVWIPAISLGEVGAATGSVSLCLVTRALERGYAPSAQALVVLASNDCRRGAVLVKNSTN
jgi:3-oxoacyl-[acyl-carrier-protein] synthase I